MKRIYNKFLIISTAALLFGGVYLYFSNSLSSTEVIPKAFGSSLTSSNGTNPVSVSSIGSDKISADISFLATLVSLKKIKIDTTLFSDKSFNKLQNNTVKIEQVTAGRINPFAPMGIDNTNSPVLTIISPTSPTSTTPTSIVPSYTPNSNSKITSKLVTDQPTQITDKSAVLNGTINTVITAKDSAYFEYGPTANLGTVTPTVRLSLVGTFIKNILGLTPKTDYFYKACAKISNITACGEVISFTTN